MSPTDVAEVMERAVHRMKQRQPDAPAPMVGGVDDVPSLYTDAEHLSMALGELMINATQASPSEVVHISASVDPLRGRFYFRVEDHGVGMTPVTLEHAFDPFFSDKPAGRQVGLGLSRAKRLVEGLGGDIELHSDEGKGTVAVLSVPLSTGTVNSDEMTDSNRRPPNALEGRDETRENRSAFNTAATQQ